MVMMADDGWRHRTVEHEEVFDDNTVTRHGGIIMNVLYAHGSKAKRVSYSASHAETLSMVNGIKSTTLITTRISELMHHVPAPDLKQLVVLQENGNPSHSLPSGFYMD